MDPLSTVVQIVSAIRFAVATYKNESKLVVAASTLMIVCTEYEETLKLLNRILLEDIRNNGSKNGADKQLERFHEQLKNDEVLLRDIVKVTTSVASTAARHNQVVNALTSLLTNRVEAIKELEDTLMKRIELVTMMLSRIALTNSINAPTSQSPTTTAENVKLSPVLHMDTIKDPEGVMFWNGYFGAETVVSFQRFIAAYQSYLTDSFLFRRLELDDLITLLKSTLLEDFAANLPQASVLNAEVSLVMFSSWLKLYGPMRDTATKCAAVSLPSTGSPVLWFKRSATRQTAEQMLCDNMKRFQDGIRAERLLVVRYSSKPEYHFVVSTLPPRVAVVQHLPIMNSYRGYSIAGLECAFAPTLVECLQLNLFDKLFTGPGEEVTLSRKSIDEWNDIYAKAAVQLPDGYYKSSDDVVAATTAAAAALKKESAASPSSLGWELTDQKGVTFGSLFTGHPTMASTLPPLPPQSQSQPLHFPPPAGVHENPTSVCDNAPPGGSCKCS